MNQKISHKHHYLPVHYLEGFTDNDNMFFVYDKKADKIFPSNPKDSFFENGLNTVTLPNGETTDYLEGLYANIENQTWPYINKIRKSTRKDTVDLLDKMFLYSFLLFLYWRLPCNIEFVEKLSEKTFAENNEFDYIKLRYEGGEKAPKEITDIIKNSEAFKKSFKQLIPFMPFIKDKNWSQILTKWRFLYTGDSQSWYILGDNPFVIKPENDKDLSLLK